MMRPSNRFSRIRGRLSALLSNKGPQVARLIYELIHRLAELLPVALQAEDNCKGKFGQSNSFPPQLNVTCYLSMASMYTTSFQQSRPTSLTP